MQENSNQTKGIKSRRDVGEPEIKERDQIWAQCLRIWKKKECNESRRDAGEHEIKKDGIESGHDAKEPESKKRD